MINDRIKENLDNYCYREDFKYSHKNPYHEKLSVFDDFVLRDEQSEALKGKWHQEIFHNKNPLDVEIGTGFGHFMQEYCEQNPERNFVGLDHRFKRSFALARRLSKIENKNFRYLRGRGERLEFIFEENEVDQVFYFFPDPWPKARHNKKRLFQRPFIDASYKVLRPGGKILIKTDHEAYFEWMVEVAQKQDLFKITHLSRDLREEHPEHFLASFETKFEKIFLSQGVLIKSMVLESLK